MPQHLYPPHPISEPELLDKLLGEVRSFLPLLQRSEMQQLLQALRDNAQTELDQIEAFSRRESSLLSHIQEASKYPDLFRIHEELNALEMERFLRYNSVTALHQNCTTYRDALARRAVELVLSEMASPPPLPFALISMGSDGREEQTLITDQDYLVVYADGGDDKADAWFRTFSETLVERMEAIGFKKCTGGIMPSFQNWRGSLQQWQRRLLGIVRYETADYGKNLMDLIVLSDARYVAGDRTTAESLIELIRTLEMDYFQALWGMAKAATEMKLALGFLKRFWTEGSGEHKGEFNLKLLAWAPLVMNVRILAMNQGVPATATVKRIELLQKEGSLSAQMAAGLAEAYRVLTKHRILLQIKVIKGIQNDAYHVNPHTLPKEERDQIRRALLLIEELQKIIHTNFSIM